MTRPYAVLTRRWLAYQRGLIMSIKITWLGHASVMITHGQFTIYIDPWKLKGPFPKADIVLVTHDHFDHYNEEDVLKVFSEKTRVIAPMSIPLITDKVKPGDELTIGGATIEATPSYNVDKVFHPKANGWVGYIVTMDNKRIYHTGDTDRIPEMKNIQADIVLMPVGGTYTMDVCTAKEAAEDIKPSLVIPIHYGDIVGSRKDAERFKQVSTANVQILNPGDTYNMD